MDHMSKSPAEKVLVPLRCDSLNGTVKNDSHIITTNTKSTNDNSDSENRIESGVMSKDIATINNHVSADVSNIEDGDGSEAETVVLPGKNSDTVTSKKTIRHEGNGTNITNGDGGGPQRNATSTSQNTSSSTKPSKSKSQAQEGAISNDKKSDKNNGTSNSSHNSPSATSSSISVHDQPQDQQHNSRSRATSESAKSRQDNSGLNKTTTTVPRKRKVSIDGLEEKALKRRIKREDNDNANAIDSKKHLNSARSESPSRQRTSIAPSNSPSVTKARRKPPPPLVVANTGKRKQSVDGDSNDSQSPKQSAVPKLTHAADSEMLKKRRDKNGRTRVARACAANNIEDVRECLKEHPEELDEPDNAGNTPLQIASLEGSTDIVKLLLKKGCKVDTENVDKDSPLIDSVENSHLAVVKLLLEAGVNPRKLNSKGEEPSELVDMEHPDGPAIKEELAKYRVKYDSKRRQSTEKGPDTGRESVSVRSPRGSPSLNARSPPPQTTRRRAGRSEATRNDLLWITATPENLVNFAGKGDDQAIMHLLNMRPVSDTEAVLAAAKGGHDSCLNLLLAMGVTDPDPAPLEDHKKGANTPMLAAIGKNNIRVIELLLEQPGFDPTRRLYKNKTYYEIAEQRGGDGWKEEYRRLKTAYDEKTNREGKKNSAKSSRTSSPKDLKKSQKDRSPSTITVRESSPTASRNGVPRKKPSTENKPDKVRDKPRDQETDSRLDRKHLKVPKRESREASNAISDREASPLGDREKRSASDQESLPKPRKRLISGRDIKQAQRRNSLVSTVSTSSAPESVKVKSSPDEATKTRRLEVDEKKDRKRSRKSASPQPSEVPKPASSTTKRPRTNSDLALSRASGNPAQAASLTRSTQSNISAPVAQMSSTEKKDAKSSSKNNSTVSSKEKTVKLDSDEKLRTKVKEKPKSEAIISDSERKKIKDSKTHQDSPRLPEIPEMAKEDLEPVSTSKVKQENIESPIKESHAEIETKTIPSPLISPQSSTVENTIETATVESIAMADTEKAIVQPANMESTPDEASNERKRSRDQEELAEETERHKRRREDEEVSRKRAAQELRERQERERYLDTMPRVLRDLLEKPEQAKTAEELNTWSALRCARGREINPECSESEKEELWVTNFQVAAILVESDLEMSHYTSWTRKPLVEPLKNIVWRVMRGTIHRWSMLDSADIMHGNHIAESYDASLICERKFFALKTFWIKLSDFEGVISRYPHLQSFKYEVRTIPAMETYKKIAEKIEEKEKNTPSNSVWGNLLPTPRPTESPDQPTGPSFPSV